MIGETQDFVMLNHAKFLKCCRKITMQLQDYYFPRLKKVLFDQSWISYF